MKRNVIALQSVASPPRQKARHAHDSQAKTFLLLALIAALVAFPLELAAVHGGQIVALVLAGWCRSPSSSPPPCVSPIMPNCSRKRSATLRHDDPDPVAAVLVEVVILAIMMSSEASPTLVRDTIYSAVMLDINGILGLAALLGGLKHGEQSYNDDSARTYSVMILTAMGVSMMVPEFIPKRPTGSSYSAFTIGAMMVLYALFLRMQVGPHSYFFSYSYPDKRRKKEPLERGAGADQPGVVDRHPGVRRGGDRRTWPK